MMFEGQTNFEAATPFVPDHNADASASLRGTALRAIAWGELIARINAARDLRRILREDRTFGSASFGDAAAGYFDTDNNGKQHVNHAALEHRKCSWRMAPSSEGAAATGDREK